MDSPARSASARACRDARSPMLMLKVFTDMFTTLAMRFLLIGPNAQSRQPPGAPGTGPRWAPALLRRRSGCGSQGHYGLGRVDQEGERLLEVQLHAGRVVAEVPDRDVLAEAQVEITAPGGQHEGPLDGRGPDDLPADEALDVIVDRVAVITRLADRRVRVGAEHDRVGAVDTRDPQVAQGLGDRLGVREHVAGQ